jgi:hypothetical protein
MTIQDLVHEFRRLDEEAAEGYVGHDRRGNDERWPTVGFRAGGGGHAVISVHPDDIGRAVTTLRQYPDGAASSHGAESLTYDPATALMTAGVRHEWHI